MKKLILVFSILTNIGEAFAQDIASNGNVAVVREQNLYVQFPAPPADSQKPIREVAVSTDGSIDVVYGESVHRDEFGISKGTFWSASGKLLAFYRMDQSMVTSYPQVDISFNQFGTVSQKGSRCAVMVPDKYPMAGERSHKVTVGVYNTETASTIYLQAGDPTDRYFTNIAWSPDEKSIYMIELNRDQTLAQLVRYDAQTGRRCEILLEERDEKYVEPMHPIRFLPWDSSKFVYISRRDGWNHIYLYEIGGSLRQLTKGEFEVIDFVGFLPKERKIVYTSNEVHPLGCNIYKVGEDGKRALADNGKGWHRGGIDVNGDSLLDNFSSPDDGAAEDLQYSMGSIKAADGVTDLYYRLVLPKDFDPEKKYPAIVYVYGGPHAHNVSLQRMYGARNLDVTMARKGYVMFCLDNRGSEHRGREFEQVTFRHLGVEEMRDQMCGVEFLKSLPYVDGERLGVHGWSFGGFMTIDLMTTYPDVFKVGVAGGPVTDWRFYEVMYGERYMDTPQTNPEGYAETSLLGKAGNLKGRLLVIYGGNDPTCVPQHSLSFVRASIDAGTHPDLFVYPGDGHNMMGSDRVHLEEHIARYFDDYLK